MKAVPEIKRDIVPVTIVQIVGIAKRKRNVQTCFFLALHYVYMYNKRANQKINRRQAFH